jgi:hypothetical protein
MNFEYKGILTHVEQKEGKNGLYTIITILTNQGKTMDCMYRGNDVLSVAKIAVMSFFFFNRFITIS